MRLESGKQRIPVPRRNTDVAGNPHSWRHCICSAFHCTMTSGLCRLANVSMSAEFQASSSVCMSSLFRASTFSVAPRFSEAVFTGTLRSDPVPDSVLRSFSLIPTCRRQHSGCGQLTGGARFPHEMIVPMFDASACTLT